jgi:hypothetical protein
MANEHYRENHHDRQQYEYSDFGHTFPSLITQGVASSPFPD